MQRIYYYSDSYDVYLIRISILNFIITQGTLKLFCQVNGMLEIIKLIYYYFASEV